MRHIKNAPLAVQKVMVKCVELEVLNFHPWTNAVRIARIRGEIESMVMVIRGQWKVWS